MMAGVMVGISAAHPLWWLALPVLLLPVWWHRQKRRRTQAEPLATARFLPSAPPRHMRVWRWDDVPLLLLRCLLLVALIAWLAAVALPWRGDTVFVDRDVPAAWADQQAAQAGMAGARRMALSGEGFANDVPANEVLPWLQSHEREWRKDARLLVLARQVAMPAQLPKLAHAVDIRIAPLVASAAAPVLSGATSVPAAVSAQGAAGGASAPGGTGTVSASATAPARSAAAADAPARSAVVAASATPAAVGGALEPAAPTALPVALVSTPERKAAWRALFAAFDAAGSGTVRHVVTEFDGAEAPPQASLVVWDRAAPPPPDWQAPLWWLPSAALPLVAGVDRSAVQVLHVDSLTLQVADSPRGRLWASDAWPPKEADTARTLYETWRALHFAPEAWPLAAQLIPPRRTSPLAMAGTLPDAWLAYALLTLFILERLVTHVRRR